jgi:predicted DCC family thiol-disulfide oxidoreductase YuxK
MFSLIRSRFTVIIDDLFGIDTRSLAVMRVGFALIVLFDFLVERLPNLTAHYGNGGVFPSEVIRIGLWSTPLPRLFDFLDSFPALPLCILIVGIFAAVFLLIGWHTRLATIVVWLSVFLIHTLNPVILQGGDVLLRLCMFIGIFLPLGARFSVDSALSYREPPKRVRSAWTGVYLLQDAMIYIFAVFSKTGLEWTTYGTAVYFALSIDQLATPLGVFTRHFPLFMMFLTFAVTLLQASAIFLLFSPIMTVAVRSVALAALLIMHISFGLHMHLGPFSWVACTALIGFVPTRWWDVLHSFLAKRFGNLTIYYDADCGFCKKSSHLIATFLALPNTVVTTAQTNPDIWKEMEAKDSWVIVTCDNGHFYTYGAGVSLLRASPLFFWLAPIMNMGWAKPIGEKVYRFIADHRKRICLPDTPTRRLPPVIRDLLTTFSTIAAIIYLIAVVSWNYSNLTEAWMRPQYPQNYIMWMRGLGLDQWWNMFAPYPLKDDGWYAISGVEQNGTEVNLLNHGWPIPTVDKPSNVAVLYPDERWRKYLMNLWSRDYSGLRHYYLQYLCRSWNSSHNGAKQLRSAKMTFMLEETLPNYTTAPVEPVVLDAEDCVQ